MPLASQVGVGRSVSDTHRGSQGTWWQGPCGRRWSPRCPHCTGSNPNNSEADKHLSAHPGRPLDKEKQRCGCQPRGERPATSESLEECFLRKHG